MQSLTSAVLATIAYADIFEYPLTVSELHRYLVGIATPLETVQEELRTNPVLSQHLTMSKGYYMLAGKQHLVPIRQARERRSAQLWHSAHFYGRWMARLPFVRMAAITGSLAVNNVIEPADIDYFVITTNNRLWLTRAFVILIVRWAARHNITLCPNYFIAERALTIDQQTLYAAREIAQMQPLIGIHEYRKFRAANRWTNNYLPNATGAPLPTQPIYDAKPNLLLKRILQTSLGDRLEKWEQQRKIPRFQQQTENSNGEASFAPDWCKGHFDQHLTHVMQVYQEQLSILKQQNVL